MKYTLLHIVLAMTLSPLLAFGQQVDGYFSADSVTVGDRFQVILIVGHDGSRDALFPDDLLPDSLILNNAPFPLGDLEILSTLSKGGRPYATGGRLDSVVYEATTFALDSAKVAGIPIGLASASDTLFGLAPAMTLKIGSLVPEDASEIKDIMPLAEFPRSWWPWILGALSVLAVILAIWWWRNRRETQEMEPGLSTPEVPPYDEAVSRLLGLSTADLSDPETIKPFYVELTDILRTYVGRRAHVPALESTTRELMDTLRFSVRGKIVPGDVLAEIDQVLSHADLVKFADLKPILEQTRSMVVETRKAIEETESAFRSEEEKRRREEKERMEAARMATDEVAMEEDR